MTPAEELIRANKGLIIRMIDKYGHGLDFEDLYSICCLRICEVAHKYDPALGSPGTFIGQYVRGAILDERRRIFGRHKPKHLPESLDALWADGFDVEDTSCSVDDDKDYEPLYDALGDLDQRDQEILGLYYFSGLTAREVGRIIGLSETRIIQRLKKMMAKLRVAHPDLQLILIP